MIFKKNGHIVVTMESGVEIRFPVAGNPRLAKGTQRQLNRIGVSPFDLHWPDLVEDLAFRGLLAGDYGQNGKNRTNGQRRRPTRRARVDRATFFRNPAGVLSPGAA